MATHPSNKDPIAKIALVVSLLLILATVFVLVSSLFNTIARNSTKGEIDTDTLVANNAMLIESNIKPIGEVTTSDGSGVVAAGPARSGEEVYTAVCQACHSTGAAGAPKIDDKAAWEPRVANGFDALMKTAIDGKGAMPARGGQNVSDAELKASIAYMTTKAGFNMDIPKDAPAAAPEAAKPTKAEEPKTEETKADTEKKTKKDAKPEVEAKTETVTPPATPDAPVTPVTPATSDTPETPATPVAESKAPVKEVTPATPVVAAKESSVSGEEIYKSTCFACHGMGVAGAPKVGDKPAWEARLAKGNDVLYTSAIKGIQGTTGVMPPKGGNFSLSDDATKAAVDYMV
ncbi:MAG: c-type cytochrome, partial [Thiotrichaceae bacterium]